MANKNDPMLPGMPAPTPGLWPDYESRGQTYRVANVHLKLSGGQALKAGKDDEDDRALANAVEIGTPLVFEVAGVVATRAHKLVDGQMVGIASLKIDTIVPAGELQLTRIMQENDRLRFAMTQILTAGDKLSEAIGSHLRNGHHGNIPRDLDEPHWEFREALGAGKGQDHA